jgi:hypothetical protein
MPSIKDKMMLFEKIKFLNDSKHEEILLVVSDKSIEKDVRGRPRKTS